MASERAAADPILSVSEDPTSDPFIDWEDWVYDTYAQVRWRRESFRFSPGDDAPKLIVLDWMKSPEEAMLASRKIEQKWPRVPVIVRNPIDDNVYCKQFLQGSKSRLSVSDIDVEEFPALMKRLHVALTPVTTQVDYNQDPAFEALLLRLAGSVEAGKRRVEWILEKFFPECQHKIPARLVSDGCSGDVVIRLNIPDATAREYFLKLAFQGPHEFRKSIDNHRGAQAWLGTRAVASYPMPGFADDAETLLKAFPKLADTKHSFYQPVCWVSGATGGVRSSLQSMFRADHLASLQQAYSGLLGLLGTSQTLIARRLQPIADPCKKAFFDDGIRRARIMAEIDSMRRYAAGVPCWRVSAKGDIDAVRSLLEGNKPDWLFDLEWVHEGHTHWDPHSRNVLVNQSDLSDILMIDCGGYHDKGYLVTDLAQIEADLKLVLMASDEEGFADLDPCALPRWVEIEKAAIEKGIEYDEKIPDAFAQQFGFPPSTLTAYRLIALIRKRAKDLRGYDPSNTQRDPAGKSWDKDGKHYFASLLFWTLRWLTLSMIRPAKKLLAIYSAAQILKKFA